MTPKGSHGLDVMAGDHVFGYKRDGATGMVTKPTSRQLMGDFVL